MDNADKKTIPRRQSNLNKKRSVELTKEQHIEVDKAIQTAAIQYKEQVEKAKENHNREDLDILDNVISEYLGSYILIGYNLNNESVEMSNCSNALEAHGLAEHFKRVFMERVGRQGPQMF
jgi:hypothetical protein